MSVLVAINKILDIKVVQWALLASVVLLLALGTFFQIRYNGLKLEHALLETKYAKMDATVTVQNQKIEEANKAYEQYQIQLQQAQQNAIKLSKTNEANKLKLKSFQFKPNSNCDEKVNQIFLQYSSMRHPNE